MIIVTKEVSHEQCIVARGKTVLSELQVNEDVEELIKEQVFIGLPTSESKITSVSLTDDEEVIIHAESKDGSRADVYLTSSHAKKAKELLQDTIQKAKQEIAERLNKV